MIWFRVLQTILNHFKVNLTRYYCIQVDPTPPTSSYFSSGRTSEPFLRGQNKLQHGLSPAYILPSYPLVILRKDTVGLRYSYLAKVTLGKINEKVNLRTLRVVVSKYRLWEMSAISSVLRCSGPCLVTRRWFHGKSVPDSLNRGPGFHILHQTLTQQVM